MIVERFTGRTLAALLGIAAVMGAGCGAHEWAQRCDALRPATGSTGDIIVIPPEHVPAIRPGLSIQDVRELLVGRTRAQYEVATGFADGKTRFIASLETDPLAHVFSMRMNGSNTTCASSTVIRAPISFLFENGLLKKIAGPQRARVFTALLHDEGFSEAEFRSIVKGRSEVAFSTEIHYTEPDAEVEVAGGLADGLGILLLKGTDDSRFRREYRRYTDQCRLLDGFAIHTGMTQTDVKGILG